MLRYCTSSCTSSHIWCYASLRRLALPRMYDATLVYVLGSGDGKTVPTKTSPSSLQKLWRTLSAEEKRVPLRCFTYPVKSTRVLFKEIELWERWKTTVTCGMKSMTNTANVENAGSINNPGCLSTLIHLYRSMVTPLPAFSSKLHLTRATSHRAAMLLGDLEGWQLDHVWVNM